MVVLRPALPEPIQPFSSTATRRDAVHLGQVVSRREPVPAAADDDDVVGAAWDARRARRASSHDDRAAPDA